PSPPNEEAVRRRGLRFALAVMMSGYGLQLYAQQADHVPPDPPQQTMAPMSEAAMMRVMQMDDTAPLFAFKLDTLERAKSDAAWSTAWNATAWYGGDFDKLLLRTEGEREHGKTDARVEAFWNHAFASFWDWQLGTRRDFGSDPARN